MSINKIDSVVISATQSSNNADTDTSHLFTESINKVSLANLFASVNDEKFLVYVPDGFLSEEQKILKQVGIEKRNTSIEKKEQSVKICMFASLTIYKYVL